MAAKKRSHTYLCHAGSIGRRQQGDHGSLKAVYRGALLHVYE